MTRSPFPGMDPYLEGDMWLEFHDTLAHQIRGQLMPLLPPDRDVPLQLQAAIEACFELVGYQRLLGYNQPPPPPALNSDDLAWVKSRVSAEEVD